MAAVPEGAELLERLGPDVAHALLDWADLNGQSVRLLLPSWLPSGTGYTGAVLVALETAPPPRVVVLKVLPEGPHRTEPGRHARALRLSPGSFAADHLVEQAFAPYPLRTGGALMFQAIAGEGLRSAVTLGALRGEEFARTAAAVARGTVSEWNPGPHTPVRMASSAFLSRELEVAGVTEASLVPWRERAGLAGTARPWFEAAGRRLPNPYLMIAGGHPDIPDRDLSALTGLTHGDLHPDNVIVPLRHGVPREQAYRLIDLGGFRADGALSRDVAMLLLSALSPLVPEPRTQQRQALLDYVVDPHRDQVALLPAEAVRRVDSVRDTAADVMGQWREPWQDQLLLSLVAGAVAFTTFSVLPPDVRDWYQLLAAHAGEAFLRSGAAAAVPRARPEPAPGPSGAAATPARRPAHPPRPQPPATGPARSGSSGPAQRKALVEALEELPAMTDPASREAVLRQLPRRLATSIPRAAVLRVELLGLVDTCITFHGGLAALWEAVSSVDPGTRERDALFEVLRHMPEFAREQVNGGP
ncbi:effector-associated domain 2-containing protein [Streptomyces sp. bgisy032]|uniref:effector-associated domain 2-containing protein n=1 Tax=Streptomyces sp. bgisy032 TaxID=3413773 RepID=UPI003D71EE48